MFVADFLYVNYVYQNGYLLIVMLTKDKYLTTQLNFGPLFDSYIRTPQESGSKNKTNNKNKKIRIMKKIFFAAVAALFFGINANAQSVNENEATVADVVAELSQADALQFIPMYQKMLTDIENVCRTENDDNVKTAKIDDLKDLYYDIFSEILVTDQNDVAINSISMEYINNRIAK